MRRRGWRVAREDVQRVLSGTPLCQRPDCGHPRLRHYTKTTGERGCGANQVWPHAHPQTGEHVPASHCPCLGFLPLSTEE